MFRSPQHLLESTPGFMRNAVSLRLEGQFGGAFQFAAVHFGGENLYMDAIQRNCLALEAELAGIGASAVTS